MNWLRRDGNEWLVSGIRKQWLAEHTNPEVVTGTLPDAIASADVFIGVSTSNVLSVADVRRMVPNAIVLALANPDPEIDPDEAAEHVGMIATGRSDYPNQINNVLCFPGSSTETSCR